jgi:hypothetical protein
MNDTKCQKWLSGRKKYCDNHIDQKGQEYCNYHIKFNVPLKKEDSCPVCFESSDNIQFPLSCGHWIHRECIYKWGKSKCPLCRKEIYMSKRERLQLNQSDPNTIDEMHEQDIISINIPNLILPSIINQLMNRNENSNAMQGYMNIFNQIISEHPMF